MTDEDSRADLAFRRLRALVAPSYLEIPAARELSSPRMRGSGSPARQYKLLFSHDPGIDRFKSSGSAVRGSLSLNIQRMLMDLLKQSAHEPLGQMSAEAHLYPVMKYVIPARRLEQRDIVVPLPGSDLRHYLHSLGKKRDYIVIDGVNFFAKISENADRKLGVIIGRRPLQLLE